MNRIKQLIEELCPEGVEWKTIDDVCNISRGRVMSKDYIRDNSGVYPVYSSQTANDGILGKINTFDYDGEYLTWTTDGAYAGSVFYRKGRFSITNVCGLLEVNNAVLYPKFLLYCLNIVAKRYVSEGMGNPKLMSNAMAKIPIPLPPLPIQQEIVTILDTFTALDASLQAELEARRKQYEHYRNQLLNFEGKEVEWKTLGEVCQVIRGKRLTKNQLSEDEQYPVFHGGLEPLGFYGLSNRTANKVMVINVGASAGTVGFSFVDFWSSDGCFCIENSNILISRYLYYALVCQENILRSKVRVAGIPTLDAMVVEKIQIPIPPLSEQERIVGILDKFDALANTELPAEIAARRKQYEYYREKLLTFEPLAN